MKAGARVALGVGLGYLLGRTKKMRLALMIAAAGATGKTGVTPGKLLQNGLSQLGSSEELTKLTGVARDQLVSAAKAAAVTAATQRIESLSERLQDGAKRPSDEEAAEDTDEETAEDTDEEPEETEEAPEEDEEPEEEPEEEPARPARARRTSGRRRAEPEPEPEDEGEDEEPAPTRARRGRTTRATTGRTPVRRARR
ncbi:hypothetical protein GCM10017786_04810 [Amycolatopsis deserti]|uniref:Uncharacterized protein n=1 Tax=Amycolatopsis deserti TaxID=185696 RepID=A0ABQ3IER7_9PSEU|nr:hypothetical protein [Amycolatopsis deserti]GHE78234.1 hypothetical protein GCM10017786_04810 [Amycolatopsis deserti]